MTRPDRPGRVLIALGAALCASCGGGGGDDTAPAANPTLTVALTAPANLATGLAGAVAVTATASDNVAVASVEFQIDGVAIGAADTSAPYADDARHEPLSERPARRARPRDRHLGQRLAVVDRAGPGRRRDDAAERLHAQRELGRRPGERDRVRAGARRASLHRPAGRDAARRQERRAAGDAVRDRRGRLGGRARTDRRRPASDRSRPTAGSTSTRPARSAAPRTTGSAASPPTATSPPRAARSPGRPAEPVGATNHNGGGMHFGGDGKLYVGVGENANGAQAQNLALPFGKLLRFNDDGSIPTDNPFFATQTGLGARDLGVRPAQSVHASRSSRAPAGSTSTTSARRPGKRSTSAAPAPTTAGPARRGPTTSAPASPRRSSPTSTPTRRRPARARAASSRGSRSPAARSTRPAARSPTATATSTTSPTSSAASSAASISPTATPRTRSRASAASRSTCSSAATARSTC